MARRKLQMTAFARFFLFLIIFVPALFFGVSYFKGEDPMQTINELLGRETTEVSPSDNSSDNSSDSRSSSDAATLESAKVRQLQDEILEKERKLEELYRENEQLKKEADDANKAAEEAKQQLESIKKALG